MIRAVLWVLVALTIGTCNALNKEPCAAPAPEVKLTRPQMCRHLLGNESNDWINCMGVGYVREEDLEHD